MKKWFGGCLVVAVVLILVGAWFGMRTMKKSLASDGSASVTIGAPPSRVFASLANGDSMRLWMAPRGRFVVSRHGLLRIRGLGRDKASFLPGYGALASSSSTSLAPATIAAIFPYATSRGRYFIPQSGATKMFSAFV